jgi:hypothetical protein
MKTVFWDVVLCGLVDVYEGFRGTGTSTMRAVMMEAAGFSEISLHWVVIIVTTMETSYFYIAPLPVPQSSRQF